MHAYSEREREREKERERERDAHTHTYTHVSGGVILGPRMELDDIMVTFSIANYRHAQVARSNY